jgi:hypothetical protein
VKGALFANESDYLREDILEIELPSDLTIDVGWYPEDDPAGAFQIVLYRDYWSNQLVPPVEVKTISDVVKEVEKLAKTYSAPHEQPLTAQTHIQATTFITAPFPPQDISQAQFVVRTDTGSAAAAAVEPTRQRLVGTQYGT